MRAIGRLQFGHGNGRSGTVLSQFDEPGCLNVLRQMKHAKWTVRNAGAFTHPSHWVTSSRPDELRAQCVRDLASDWGDAAHVTEEINLIVIRLCPAAESDFLTINHNPHGVGSRLDDDRFASPRVLSRSGAERGQSRVALHECTPRVNCKHWVVESCTD